MRLSPTDRESIRRVALEVAGADATVRLFGSRLDDTKRGGDIDLMVSVPHAVNRPAWLGAALAARLERALGGRKVDVVLHAPNLAEEAVHRVALSEGAVL